MEKAEESVCSFKRSSEPIGTITHFPVAVRIIITKKKERKKLSLQSVTDGNSRESLKTWKGKHLHLDTQLSSEGTKPYFIYWGKMNSQKILMKLIIIFLAADSCVCVCWNSNTAIFAIWRRGNNYNLNKLSLMDFRT